MQNHHLALPPTSRRQAIARLAALPLAALAPTHSVLANEAGAWPAKPVRLIVNFPPGSSPDVVGRAMADDLAALQDRVEPFPSDVARAMVLREGRDRGRGENSKKSTAFHDVYLHHFF